MRFRLGLLISATTILTGLLPAHAETRIADKLKHYTLDNGMQVFVYPRDTAPVFCGMIFVDAGSAEENVNETGLAHLLEHMAFKGTPWVGTSDWEKERPILIKIEETAQQISAEKRRKKPDTGKIESLEKELAALQEQAAAFTVPNQYDNIITRAGGTEVNATTSADYTNYYLSLPSNQLELWALMESQRLRFPSWREFYKERDVVAEERRMRSEDSPTGKLYENFITNAYTAHAYRNPVIGWMSDIYNLHVTNVSRFYREWYVPENFVAVVVGDVNPDEVHSTINKYFGAIPARKSPIKAVTAEPDQAGERRVKVQFDAEPQAMIGWHKPTFPDADTYVFEVIQYLLSRSGRSSRLYERLIKNDGLCQSVDAFTAPGDKYPNLFMVYLTTRAPHTVAEAERALYEEIEKIKREPISDAELEKIRSQIDAEFIKELETNRGFARQFGYYYLASEDPAILDTMRDEMKKVTPQDIQRVASKYLTANNRTVAEIETARTQTPTADENAGTIEIKADDSQSTPSQATDSKE